MKRIKIGQIVNTVGLKGEVKIYSFAENLQRFEDLKEIFVENELFLIEKSRLQKTTVVLKLEEINSREMAEAYRNKFGFLKLGCKQWNHSLSLREHPGFVCRHPLGN